MAYILMDESGDLGFDFDKAGTSRYFLLTFLVCENKRPIEKCVREVHAALRQRHRKVSSWLHASREEPSTRSRLLRKLAQRECAVMIIYLNKRRVYTRLQDEKSVLYNYVTNILLDRIFSKRLVSGNRLVFLIASRKETNKFLNLNFREYLERQGTSNHGISLKVQMRTPAEEKALQAADFVSWAIFREYEYGDDSYSNLIAGKIVEKNPLFA